MDKIKIESVTLELKHGDISAQDDIDAVVNAANAILTGGGGVDGALHRAAGPELKKASQPLGPIEPGEAVITSAFNLPNDYVIHCLGPVYGQDKPEDKLLADCYKNALKLAEEKKAKSIAFPAISTGAFGYPIRASAKVVFQTFKNRMPKLKSVQHIRIVLWGEDTMRIYEEEMDKAFG